METDGDSAGFSPFSTFVGSFQAMVADTWLRRSASSLLKTEGVRCTTSIARLRADTLWSNDRVTFRFYSETDVFFFLLKTSSKTDKKTELGWDYRTAVTGKKASALPCFASLFSSLGMSYTWNIWHTYSFDIYYIFFFFTVEKQHWDDTLFGF